MTVAVDKRFYLGKYCFLFKHGCSGIVHRSRKTDGLPACGTYVDRYALEHTDDGPCETDKCKRCFPERLKP